MGCRATKINLVAVTGVGCGLLMAAERGYEPCFQEDTGQKDLEARNPRQKCCGGCRRRFQPEPKERSAEEVVVEMKPKKRKVRRVAPEVKARRI